MASGIFIVRHGETEWSATGRHTGSTDVPLTAEGRRQASTLVAKLRDYRFTLVLCSPLRRARETCEQAGFAEVAEICDDLREWDYGDYEGLTTPEIRAINPDWNLWTDGCPGGETPEQVAQRTDRVLERVPPVGVEVLLFAHGHLLRVLTARWLQMPPAAGARFALAAGALGVLGYERETEVVDRWNA